MADKEKVKRLASALKKRKDAKELVKKSKRPLFDKEKIADRIPADGGYPGGTSGVVDAVRHYLTNDDNYVGDRIKDAMDDASLGVLDPESLSQMLAHEDAKRIYLGMPQVYGSFEPSPYRPTVGTMENPYQLNGLLSDDAFENIVFPMYATWKTGQDWPLYDTAPRVTDLGRTAQLSDFPYLHRAGMSEGFDDKGQYISLHDVWDYNTAVKGKGGDNVAKYVGGKPFDIYQRYYLDDWLDVPDEAKGNPYIAPSYIEADYTWPRYVPDYTFWGLPQERGEWDPVNGFACGGKKYPGGGKFFRTNLQNESPLMYQPMVDINYPIETPYRFRPQPDLGDYRAPESTGMMVDYPINLPERVPVAVQEGAPAPVVVDIPAENLFSDEMVARRALKQRYAESAFNDKAKSKAGAQGAWQIMPITLKDYLGRGRGKAGDLNDPEYNRKVRDWVMGIIPRDLQEFWSDDDSDINKLAKLYAAYNWGAGNLRGFLRKKQKAGVDISNPDNWVGGLNPETRNYVTFLAMDKDVDGTALTNSAFENAARKRGYMAEGGRLFEDGGPEKQNWFTRMMLNSVMNDPYTGAVATASGWTRDKNGNVTQTEESANSEGAKRLRAALAEIAAMPLTDLAVDVVGAAVVGTKTYKSIKLARELNKMLKAGEFDAAVDMAREASKAEPIVKASTTLPVGYPSSSDYSLTRVPAGLPAAEQPVNLVNIPDYAGQVRDAVKAGKWGNLRFYRNIDGVPYTTDSGLIRLGKDENALVNVTSDLPFRLHSDYKAAPGAEYLVIDPDAFIGKTPLSIEPMDTFFPNVGMDVEPKYVKIITGNKEIIPEIESKRMKALTSPELQDLYSKIGGDFGSDAAAAYRDAVDKYITENIGRPSLADYAHLEEVTGLKSGTVPLSEQEVYNAAKKASKEVEDTYDWMSKMGLDSGKYVRGLSGDIRWPYTYANGRDVSAISFSKEPIIGTGGKVFYDTAPPVEAGLMESLGSYSHPNIDRLNSILEFSLDPNGYHYFDPQIGKVGFIMPFPIRASGGKIHIKPENRGKFTALKKRTGHSASWFKAHGTPAQKKMAVFALNSRKWGNRKDEGGENLIAEYPEGYNGELRQGKSFNALDRYLANHPMVGHRLRKAKTLLLDAARVHPLTSFATDVYDSYVGPQDESDKITTPLGVVGRGGDIILNTVKQAGEIEPNMKKVFGRSAFGRLVSLPDFIDDSLKFVRDFAEPVTSFENGGEIEREPDNFTVRDNTYVSSLIPRGFGFNPAEERPLPPSLGQARWDDGITGAFPFIGDGLQGLQAIRDFRQGDPVTGFQTAGMLLIPNIAEKAVRGLFRKSTALSALDDVASGPPQTLLEKMRALRERADAERVLAGDIPHPTRTVLSPEELGVEKDIPQDVKERFYSSSMERMRRQRPETNAKEIGHKFGDVTNRTYREYPQSTFDKAGAGYTTGRHYDSGHIAVSESSKDVGKTIGHELRHELDWQVPLTENEKSILTDAYGDDFINTGRSGKSPKILKREEVTTNFDARNMLLGDKISLSVDEQNALIDAATPKEIGTAVYKANGYGSSFIKKLVDEKKWTMARVNKIKEAMKTVGAVSGAAAISRALYNDEELPVQLSDGGLIDRYSPEQIRSAIAKLKETRK